MRITCCYSAGRTEVGLIRRLDGQRRSLVIMCPFGQPPAETLKRLRPQLTDEEAREVALAFGFGMPPRRESYT